MVVYEQIRLTLGSYSSKRIEAFLSLVVFQTSEKVFFQYHVSAYVFVLVRLQGMDKSGKIMVLMRT